MKKGSQGLVGQKGHQDWLTKSPVGSRSGRGVGCRCGYSGTDFVVFRWQRPVCGIKIEAWQNGVLSTILPLTTALIKAGRMALSIIHSSATAANSARSGSCVQSSNLERTP